MRAILFKEGITEGRLGSYPRGDMQPIEGLEQDLEWLIVVEDDKPVYDPEKEQLTRNTERTITPHATFTHLNVYRIWWTASRKSDDLIKERLEQKEEQANVNLTNRQIKLSFLYNAVLHRKIQGLNITAKQQAILDKGDALAVKIWQNETTLQNKIQELTDTGDTDLKVGWTNE